MSYRIAITGKGGTGKTTVAALVVDRLSARGARPVLAVDADPNTCLDAALGVDAVSTVGRVREKARDAAQQRMSGGPSKQELLEMKINEGLVESEDFDLIAMGRSEGPGCYCYANSVLKGVLGRLSDQYPFVVLDNEAGLENLSRRLVSEIDLLVLVSDPSRQGMKTVQRIYQLAGEMGLTYKQCALVVNRMRGSEFPSGATYLRHLIPTCILCGLPHDDTLAEFSEGGRSLRGLPGGSPVTGSVDLLLDRLGIAARGEVSV